MNTQEAYKTLDLAKGLGMDRVEVQFTKLKTEMESKMASTSNERYVRIEQMRFTSKIVLEKEIDATALGLTIPPMILQPLVENAFIHGLDTNSTDIQTIRLTIKEPSPIKLGISVSNPKTNEAVFYPKHNSFGIKSIEQRLKLVNPDNRLTVHDLDNQFRIDLELFVNV